MYICQIKTIKQNDFTKKKDKKKDLFINKINKIQSELYNYASKLSDENIIDDDDDFFYCGENGYYVTHYIDINKFDITE